MSEEKVVYREVQKMRHWWVILLVVALAAVAWYGMVQQIILGRPFGSRPAPDGFMILFWILFGIVFPLALLTAHLTVEVRKDGLYVKYFPFHFTYKIWSLKKIANYYDVIYSPIRRFGGWGIRYNMKGEKAYNIGGVKGVEIHLKTGRVILIGTEHPQEFVKALNQVFRR